MIRQRKWSGTVARDLRVKHGLSPEEVAERTGTHRATVYAWEAGQSPQMRHAVSLADLYEVPLDTFFIALGPSTTTREPCARNGKRASAELAK